MSKRRQFSPQFKADTVLEYLRGQKTQAQLCREREIGADLLARWRDEFFHHAPEIFETTQTRSLEQQRIAELEHLVGRLTIELDASKKASGLLDSLPTRNGRSFR